jgi:nitrogen regulatory protein P-II 1
MKNLVMVVHADVQQRLADALRTLPQVAGFTFTHVEGHGPQSRHDPAVSDRDMVVGYTPHVRVDLILEDEHVDDVLKALRAANCGVAGRGVYWISRLEAEGRL